MLNFEHKNGWIVSHERLSPSGMHLVQLRDTSGSLHYKVRCDDYHVAHDYFQAFKELVKAA